MADSSSYCEFTQTLDPFHVHRVYHDTQYGFPLTDDNELFGRLILEINQAGLSWLTILNKQENFRKAYDEFEIEIVANYREADYERLRNDAGIIRNRLKIQAAIHNAQQIIGLQEKYGSFMAWLDANHPLDKAAWVKLFKKTFRFTGGEITHEFLMSTGYLPGAHEASCPIFAKIRELSPPWQQKS
ncbi:MAG: DNA-3-methyladenine glycosylase I [Bacteroidota bacterium]